MKKILIFIISFLIVGCSLPFKQEVTVCTKTLEEPVKIQREISLHHKGNLIGEVLSVETFYFSEEFTVEMFEKLEADMLERHLESKNLSFETKIESEMATMTIVLKDLEKASVSELMLVGLNKDDDKYLPGIVETVRFNEKAGYTCKQIEE